jgi:AcrR family transcriptional regulator
MSLTDANAKTLRTDARRNYEALVAAAREVFAELGTDAPLDVIARRAGVGRGTLYRHFPAREHLFVAIMQERVDALASKAQESLGAGDAFAALEEWLRLYDRNATDYRGMSAHVSGGLADAASPVAPLCAPLEDSLAMLVERARGAGQLRGDISAVQILTLIGSLPKDRDTGRTGSPYLDVVLDGLRPPRRDLAD